MPEENTGDITGDITDQDVQRLAAVIEHHPDRIDPAEAGAIGLAQVDRLDAGRATGEAVAKVAIQLLTFAVGRAPDHPDAPLWQYRAASALAYLADERVSVTDLDAAIAAMAGLAGDGIAPPDVAEWAAVDAARLTATRLAGAVGAEDLAPDQVRRLTDALAAIESVVRTEEEVTDFLFQRASAHRWAYVCGSDVDDLERTVSGMDTVLRRLPADDDLRPDALEAFAAALGERFLLAAEPAHLEAAIGAAVEARSLLVEDDPRLPWVRCLFAQLLAIRFWNTDEKDDADRDTAIAEYAAVPELDADHARDYGFLLCFRFGATEDVDDLRTGLDVLAGVAADPAAQDWWLTSTLAEAHMLLVDVDGTHHLWELVDWSTRALGYADQATDDAVDVRTDRLTAIESAGKEFGIDTVLARYDVWDMLADAESAVRDLTGASPQARARLAARAVMVNTAWLAELHPLDDGDALRASVRAQVDMLNGIKASLPAEDHAVLDGLADVLDMTADAFAGSSETGPMAELARWGRLLDPASSPAPQSVEDEAEAAMTAFMGGLFRVVSAGGDPQQLLAEFTSLVWRVDALPPSDRREDMQEMLTALSWTVGPRSGPPPGVRLPRFNDAEAGEFARLYAMANEWQTVLAAGDVQRALWMYQAIERIVVGVRPGTFLELAARMVRGTCRARLSTVVPTEPAALDAAIADLETAWQQEETAATAVALGSRLRLRDRPDDRTASRDLGVAAINASTVDDREAGENMIAWCLDDDADDDLVRVLEARRALALAGAGITDSGPVTGPDEVRAALRAADADTLVYLAPACAAHSGIAVLVPMDGPVRVIPLPLLRTEPALKYSKADERAWRTALTDVCQWMWEAAGAELVRAVEGARVVLVPLGVLGLVPWAAAWRDVDGRRRYLVEDLELSVAPSARLLGQVAARPPVATDKAVFVGNPNRDDATAGVSAEALRNEFFPGGLFLGGHGEKPRPWRPSADGSGTPDEVRAAIAGGLSVLHLGCRAESDVAVPRSQVVLHGQVPLSVNNLSADIGLVTLANHAVVHGTDYDTARTLPTDFLAAGARSVLATLWPASTADLVLRVHRHMRENGSTPRAAIRAAQLAMLDTVETWASVVHLGV
ncbi:CHAT domain-containing protein [Actinocrispum wychmicini]|uniref:CHAT domain-containing protein n=1 Tax=Actinocrispum wychmicini TaxID=1213861 RepID=A0A4R2J374_9PSEU|nr:CHAT domain-containing protein [Actinocrispum wychmicini]TCO52911.1 CHAT domain-containing protein [Actinocrispum wychmicini]